MLPLRWLLLCACTLLSACAPLPTGAPGQPIVVPSPNHDERRPNYVILHQTSNDRAADALRTLTDPARKVSSHYLIDRDGTLYHLVDERRRAWHAGVSYWGGNTDLNSASLGIELDNNGVELFPEAQITALLALLEELQTRYQIPPPNFLGHGDVAPRRKVDPSRYFPWQRLAEVGFGIWCRAPSPLPAESADAGLLLRAFGYDMTDPQAALTAFRRHFRGEDFDGAVTPDELAMLRCLIEEKNGF
ncbi:MAG: N-acetylmuramoyl-L-alanine amidase [Gammaproteobacteria bacterium]|nr:N-acetylmuramoyl-L-alanine amidase [Rhodocyclaceae bacterium]MBU3908638.1 N-acetylmuramoyl-L-alanine amidase [Gammaproteobacteria bacterium]MBU3988692.1 N-acetylmuramoyl-L-alanine amidase [Gammaproteobacteria bacterium]MBU4004666.1 N-acetylmuramoyl-L-alanine amidase [Gammaproteobacteria bacterium]MBU4021269.1 N-acetylmuramoyl-L-alanine amidase [Gammaproteobacteria bacterium]